MTESLAGTLSLARGAAEPALVTHSVSDVLSQAAARYPQQDAVVSVFQGRSVTFAALEAWVDRVALALVAMGLESGERIGIWSPNRLEWVAVQRIKPCQ